MKRQKRCAWSLPCHSLSISQEIELVKVCRCEQNWASVVFEDAGGVVIGYILSNLVQVVIYQPTKAFLKCLAYLLCIGHTLHTSKRLAPLQPKIPKTSSPPHLCSLRLKQYSRFLGMMTTNVMLKLLWWFAMTKIALLFMKKLESGA